MSRLGQHDGDGIRYAMHLSAPKGGSVQMLRDPAGGWVSWEDYARLKAEVERLTKGHSIDFVRAEMYRHLLDENAKLKEEVMRMRNDAYKEGDILQKCCEHQKNRIERLKAEVERLTKAGEWQPIETAPKDGGTILTYRKGNVFVLNQYYGNSSYEMTHWMPLPSAPAKEVQS